MKVSNTTLEGVLLIEPPTLFEDFRGRYIEFYNRDLYKKNGIEQVFLQDDFSISTRHVLKGFHGDKNTWKLVGCPFGKFYFVVVNWDETSSQYKKWEAFTLSQTNNLQVLVPPNFGSAHLILSDEAVFHYKQTTYYDRNSQFTIAWNDPKLGVWWPIKDPITSLRDRGVSDERSY